MRHGMSTRALEEIVRRARPFIRHLIRHSVDVSSHSRKNNCGSNVVETSQATVVIPGQDKCFKGALVIRLAAR